MIILTLTASMCLWLQLGLLRVKRLISSVFLLHFLNWDKCFHWSRSLVISLTWIGSKHLESPCLCFLTIGTIAVCYCVQILWLLATEPSPPACSNSILSTVIFFHQFPLLFSTFLLFILISNTHISTDTAQNVLYALNLRRTNIYICLTSLLQFLKSAGEF